MPYKKTAPIPVDLVKTKRGIIFSLNLSQAVEQGTAPTTPATVPTSPASSAAIENSAELEKEEALVAPQMDPAVGRAVDSRQLSQALFDLEDGPASPTDSHRSKRSRYSSQDNVEDGADAISSFSATGYGLEVSVHKITSSRLLSRFQKNSQESKFFASILHPSLLPKALKEPEKEKGDHIGAYRKQKRIGQTTSTVGECNWCGTKKTAQWRKGPTGARGLCNVSDDP
jgi:hypothetical protein